MESFSTSEHVAKLKKAAAAFEFSLEDIKVVDDIREWCTELGIPEDRPLLAVKVVRNRKSGKYLVLVARKITPDMIELAKQQMCDEGLDALVERLINNESYLTHRILREIYHAFHDMLGKPVTATECDRWAFQQMGILPSV